MILPDSYNRILTFSRRRPLQIPLHNSKIINHSFKNITRACGLRSIKYDDNDIQLEKNGVKAVK